MLLSTGLALEKSTSAKSLTYGSASLDLQETLSTRNALLEKFISMQQQAAAVGSPSIVEGATDAWWLDDRTKCLIEQTLRLSGVLTFTVRPGQILRLTRQEVTPNSLVASHNQVTFGKFCSV